jgi:transcriptional regulator with XRE-family HTH domain
MNIRILYDLKKKSKFTWDELAEIVEMTPPGIRNAIKNNDIMLSNLQKLAKAFDVPMSIFFEEDELMQVKEPDVEYKKLTTNLIEQKDKYIERLEKDYEKLEEENEDLRCYKKKASNACGS